MLILSLTFSLINKPQTHKSSESNGNQFWRASIRPRFPPFEPYPRRWTHHWRPSFVSSNFFIFLFDGILLNYVNRMVYNQIDFVIFQIPLQSRFTTWEVCTDFPFLCILLLRVWSNSDISIVSNDEKECFILGRKMPRYTPKYDFLEKSFESEIDVMNIYVLD